ncbi:hypothetical protein [Thermogemmatispora sp.]|nr:hypothetical protein [Thermogemmatispora sp.]
MNDYLIGWKIRWSPMLAPDQGMVPDASVFALAEQGARLVSEPTSPDEKETGECSARPEEEKESILTGDLWGPFAAYETEASLELEWIEQVCCHIEVMTAGAGEGA